MKNIYIVKENCYNYIEISATYEIDNLFKQLNHNISVQNIYKRIYKKNDIKNDKNDKKNDKKNEMLNMVKYPLKILDIEYKS